MIKRLNDELGMTILSFPVASCPNFIWWPIVLVLSTKVAWLSKAELKNKEKIISLSN